jgi:hypothetical protein
VEVIPLHWAVTWTVVSVSLHEYAGEMGMAAMQTPVGERPGR